MMYYNYDIFLKKCKKSFCTSLNIFIFSTILLPGLSFKVTLPPEIIIPLKQSLIISSESISTTIELERISPDFKKPSAINEY